MHRFRFLIAVPVAALLVLSGYGASSLLAGASSTPKTYFACLSGGTLTKVGTKSPTCPPGAKVISWDQVGQTGAPGVKGDTGAIGPKGDTGTVGSPGVKGDTGAIGPQGVKGDTGPKGDAGVKGDAGAKGDTGAPGAKGDTGPQGPVGPQAAHVSPSCHPWYGNNSTSTDLVGCNLRGIDVQTHLNGMNLTNADLRRSYIGVVTSAVFDGADLRFSTLSTSNSDFKGANLEGANIQRGEYDDFTGAVLVNADLHLIGNEVFDNADLTGASVGYSDFNGSSFVGAKVGGIDWSHATCPDGTFGGDNPGSTCVGHGPGL